MDVFNFFKKILVKKEKPSVNFCIINNREGRMNSVMPMSENVSDFIYESCIAQLPQFLQSQAEELRIWQEKYEMNQKDEVTQLADLNNNLTQLKTERLVLTRIFF